VIVKRASSFVPFVAGCVAIWCVSAMPRPPVPEELQFWNSDKLMHFAAYAVLCALAMWGSVRRHGWTPRALVTAALMTSAYGIVDEVHQSFVPGRSVSVLDWIADTSGAAAVALVCRRKLP
jgi:VanZ family protein